MWPGAPEELDGVFKTYDVSDEEINKMTHLNAMKLYHFEPFKDVPREQATVGALRAAAGDHDVTIQALSKHEKNGPNFQEWAAGAKAMSGAKD
jgi:hypothetical protein